MIIIEVASVRISLRDKERNAVVACSISEKRWVCAGDELRLRLCKLSGQKKSKQQYFLSFSCKFDLEIPVPRRVPVPVAIASTLSESDPSAGCNYYQNATSRFDSLKKLSN